MEQIIIGLIIIFLAFILFKKYPLEKRNVKKLTLSAIFIVVIVVCKRFFTLTIPFFGLESFQVGIEYIPAMIAGILLLPSYACIIGLSCDMIGLILVPTGFPFLGFTLSMILVVVLPSLIEEISKTINVNLLDKIITLILRLLSIIFLALIINIDTIKMSDTVIELNLTLKIVLSMILLVLIVLITIIVEKYKKNLKENDLKLFIQWVLSVLAVEILTTVILSPLWLALMYNIPFIVSLSLRIIKEVFIIPLNIFMGYPVLKIISRNTKSGL